MKFSRFAGVLLALALPFTLVGVAEASTDTFFSLTATSVDGSAKTVHLQCSPPDGNHPRAHRACAELRAAHGDFDALPGKQGPVACTMEYLPVTASVAGIWRGQLVTWQREFSNRCGMYVKTGSVFQF